jgi:hypothetical protein
MATTQEDIEQMDAANADAAKVYAEAQAAAEARKAARKPAMSEAPPKEELSSPVRPDNTPSADPNDPFRLGLDKPSADVPGIKVSGGPGGLKIDSPDMPIRTVNGAPPGTKAAARAATNAGGEESVDLGSAPTSGGGGGGRLIPAGFQPDKMSEEVKVGKPVPAEAKAALGAAAGLQIEAAGQQREADKALYKQQRGIAEATMAANADAAAKHARIQQERDQIVRSRLAEIENLNKQAQVQSTDMWSDKAAAAQMIGTLFSALTAVGVAAVGARRGSMAESLGRSAVGEPMQIMDAAINRDIDAKLRARKSAGEQAGKQAGLLGLHLDQLRDQDKAVEATRLAYYDNILQQAEVMKADHASQVSDAAYNNLVADVLTRRADTVRTIAAQEANDVHQSFTQKWHAAQLLGSSGNASPGIRQTERVITVPASDMSGEKKIHVAVPHEAYTDLEKMAGATGALAKADRDALALRRKAREILSGPIDGTTAKKLATVRNELTMLQNQRISTEQKANGEGVTRDNDFKHAMEMGVDYTGEIPKDLSVLTPGHDATAVLRSMADHDRVIMHSMNLMHGVLDARVRGATGYVVQPSVVQEPAHEGKGAPMVTRPGWKYTGQIYSGQSVPPEGEDVE